MHESQRWTAESRPGNRNRAPLSSRLSLWSSLSTEPPTFPMHPFRSSLLHDYIHPLRRRTREAGVRGKEKRISGVRVPTCIKKHGALSVVCKLHAMEYRDESNEYRV
jgi:hypothetical protein